MLMGQIEIKLFSLLWMSIYMISHVLGHGGKTSCDFLLTHSEFRDSSSISHYEKKVYKTVKYLNVTYSKFSISGFW